MPLSEADELRLANSIKVGKIPKIHGAKNEWVSCAEASSATFVNACLGQTIEIPRSSFEEFGLDEVKLAIQVSRIKALIEEIELDNSVVI